MEWGWFIAAFQLGMIVGGVLVYVLANRKKPGPVLMPYRNPVLTHRPGEPIDEKLINNGTAEMLKLDEAELQAMTSEIMAEANVDEATARKEVALILAEANAVGQG